MAKQCQCSFDKIMAALKREQKERQKKLKPRYCRKCGRRLKGKT